MKIKHMHPDLLDVIFAVAGILFSGFALKSFLVPNGFLDGGVTGVSLLISEIFGKTDESKNIILAISLMLINLPFIVMGAFQINKGFAYKTFACIAGLALYLFFVPEHRIIEDKLLVSIFGGIFLGIGIGLAMRAGCAIDGIEVVALYTGKRMSFSISEIILGFNVILFLIAAVKFGPDKAFYSILTYFAASRAINFIVEGLEEYTGVTIISGKSEEIKEVLVMQLGRGITIYKGERGFMKNSFDVSQPADIIFTIITRFEVRRLKNLIHEIDPKAFVFTNIIKEASGGVLKKKKSH